MKWVKHTSWVKSCRSIVFVKTSCRGGLSAVGLEGFNEQQSDETEYFSECNEYFFRIGGGRT